MVYIFSEGGYTIIQFPMVYIKDGDVAEEEVELVVDVSGKVVKGPYATVQDAYSKALENLSKALQHTEAFLDRLEYRLEMEEKVNPGDVYTASYMAHFLHYAALQLYFAGRELRRRGHIPHKLYGYSRRLLRRAHVVRRYARDLRLLHATVVQLSLDASMKKLTWLGTLAMPALIITGFYGMNLEWLPLADNPPAVFLILSLVTAVFAYIINKI
jgi:Mg2+ and Co2+ transporter CorA